MKKNQLLIGIFILAMMATTISCKRTDSEIQRAVQVELATNPDASAVVVTVEKGVVTLTGEVENLAVSIIISSQAAGVKDVKSVVNNLTVLSRKEREKKRKGEKDDKEVDLGIVPHERVPSLRNEG